MPVRLIALTRAKTLTRGSTMPKSGKFVIKKSSSQSNDLVRNHLQKKDSTAGAPASDGAAGEDAGGTDQGKGNSARNDHDFVAA